MHPSGEGHGVQNNGLGCKCALEDSFPLLKYVAHKETLS